MRGTTRSYLTKAVVLPLSGSALCFAVFAWLCPLGGLWLNLLSTTVGIGATVLYVDRVLARREAERWQDVDTHAQASLVRVANSVATSVRSALGVAPPPHVPGPGGEGGIAGSSLEYLHAMQGFAGVPLRAYAGRMRPKQWGAMMHGLQSSSAEIDRLLVVFGHRLPPPLQATTLELRDAILGLFCRYATWPDIIGVEESELPTRRDGSKVTRKEQRALTDLACEALDEVLTHACGLGISVCTGLLAHQG